MSRQVIVIALAGLTLSFAARAVTEELPPAARWIPGDAVFVLEIVRPEALLDAALDGKVAAAIQALPAYKAAAASPGFQQFTGFLSYLESQLAVDWKTALRQVFGGGALLAAMPGDGAVLVVDSRDGKILGRLHEAFAGIARTQALKSGGPDPVASTEHRGITCWSIAPAEAHAILGNRLILANRRDVLEKVLDSRAEAAGERLDSLPAYKEAREAAGGAALAAAYVNLTLLKQHPPIREALARARNPLESLLLAGVTDAVLGSRWLSGGLYLEGDAPGGDTLALRITADGSARDPAGPAAIILSGKSSAGVLPNVTVPRFISGLTLYRDLHGFYAAKDKLFPERTSGLIFFENMMGIFFSGLDLTEEVFAETYPEIRVVVAEQAYDPALGIPRVQMPAFAVVFRLRRPAEFGEVAEEAWQKALGLVNFTRGQQAEPGLILDRVSRGDTKFSVAYFRSPKGTDKKDIPLRFNFRPALARVGEYLVMSSTDGLAADLIDALGREATLHAKAVPETDSLLEIDGAGLLSVLRANRENMVLQNMLEKGHERQQAEGEIGLFLDLLRWIERARFQLGSHGGRPRGSLEVQFRNPLDGTVDSRSIFLRRASPEAAGEAAHAR